MAFDEAYFAFQAVKGIQANKEYFISMVPLFTISIVYVFLVPFSAVTLIEIDCF